MTSIDWDTTYCSEFEKRRGFGLRNQKTVKYPTSTSSMKKKKKKNIKGKKLRVVKHCSNIADNLIKKEEVYVSDVSFSMVDNKLDVKSGILLKLERTDIRKITTKKPKERPIQDNVPEDTVAIENCKNELVEFFKEIKSKRANYKEVISSQSDSEDGVQILSAEMTEEDRLDGLIVFSQSRTYLESMMDCCKIEQ